MNRLVTEKKLTKIKLTKKEMLTIQFPYMKAV